MLRRPDAKTALLEKLKRQKALEASKPLELDTSFPAQNAFVNDTSRFLAAQCSRRAGKSNALALKFFRTMEKYPNTQCVYLALTRDSAYNIMWPVLQAHDEKYKIGCEFTPSKLTVTHPNGARLRLIGADTQNFIKRLKGIECPGVAIDEAQDFGTHLESLIDDVLVPTLAKFSEDGWLALTGTPGPVPNGYFFEVTQNGKYGYSVHKWTILDNPHIPKAKAFIDDLKAKRQWDDRNPTLLREWRNNWVLDTNSLWVRYSADLNDYDHIPNIAPHKYNYILGVDIGYKDADALAVLGWSEQQKTCYLVEELITPKQDITDLTNNIKYFQEKYKPDKIVMDAGALGKKIHEELTRRHQIPIEAADKTRKQENVELLNDALRTGNFKAAQGSRFAQDSYLVQIDWDKSTPDRIIIKKHPHSDIIDAVLYAFKVSPAYAYQKPPELPPVGSKEWANLQETEMFESTLEALKREHEANNPSFGWE